MSLFAAVVTWSGIAFELVLLAGLVARNRVRQCYLFGVYILISLFSALVVSLRPNYYTWNFWIAKEFTHALLLFLLALELSWRAFRPVPRAWWWSRMAIAASTGLGVTLVVTMPPGPVSVRIVPWILAALAWLYTLLGVITLLFEMPQEPLHRAILWGFAPYLMLYAATWGQTGEDATLPGVLNPVMFILVLAVQAATVWRRDQDILIGHPETVKWLWHWRR